MSRPIASATRSAAAAAAVLLAACARPAAAQQPARAADTVPLFTPAERNVGVLRPGDMLKVAVYRDKELTGDYLIDSRGYVQIPGLGDLPVAGLTPVQITERLREQLARRGVATPEIAVWPLIRLSVIGEVLKPGLYPVDPGTSLIQLLTIAGGPNERANLRHAHVIRAAGRFPVDLESALGGSATGRVVLNSNDVLVVPRKTGFTRENLGFIIGSLTALVTVLNLVVTLQR